MNRLIIVILLFLMPVALFSQHFFAVSMDAMMVGEVDDLELTQSLPGGGAGLSATYFLQKNHFIMQTGLSARFVAVGQTVDSVSVVRDMHSTAYVPQISLPLMLGATWDRYYAMAGVNLAYNLGGISHQNGTYLLLSDEDDKHYPDYNQEFSKILVTNKSKLWSYPDLRLTAEFGAKLPIYYSKLYGYKSTARIGLFAEYGLLNGMPSYSKSLVAPNPSADIDNIQLEHIHATYSRDIATKHHWAVGLRLTFLFKLANLSNNDCMCSY